MGDLSKLKMAVGQIDVAEGCASRNEAAIDKAIDAALDEGADVLAVPTSLEDASEIRLIGLNDTRIDVAGNVRHVRAVKATDNMGYGIDLAYVFQKFVAQAFAFGGTGHKTGDIDEADGGGGADLYQCGRQHIR